MDLNSQTWFDLEDEAWFKSVRTHWGPLDMYFNLSLDKQIHTRSIYSALDLLKDIGGLLKTSTVFG